MASQSKYRTIPKFLRRTGAVTLFVAAGALAGNTVGGAATACAVPKEWDIGDYDKCVAAADDRFITGQTDSATHADEYRFCCQRSGGVWGGDRCVSPPARGAATVPGIVAPPAVVAEDPPPPGPPQVTFTRVPGVLAPTG